MQAETRHLLDTMSGFGIQVVGLQLVHEDGARGFRFGRWRAVMIPGKLRQLPSSGVVADLAGGQGPTFDKKADDVALGRKTIERVLIDAVIELDRMLAQLRGIGEAADFDAARTKAERRKQGGPAQPVFELGNRRLLFGATDHSKALMVLFRGARQRRQRKGSQGTVDV